jgi:hypothetical protein
MGSLSVGNPLPKSEDRMSQSTLASALLAAQAKMKNAAFNKTNPHFKNKYADLTAVREAAIPVLSEHGIAVVQFPGWDASGRFCLTTRLLHAASGEIIEGAFPLPDAGKPQEIGAAITYARRYGLVTLAGLTSEEDDDGETAAPVVRAPNKRGVTAIKKDLRDLSAEMHACKDLEAFDLLVAGARHLIEECQVQIPVWYHGDGSDSEGLAKTIERRRAELKKPPPTAIRPGTMNPHQPFDNPPPF